MCLQKALGSSAQLHKRALHFEHACRAKDGTIARQQAAMDSRHHDISVLQNKVDDLKQTGTQQQAALDSRHHDISVLQSTVDDLKQTGTQQQAALDSRHYDISVLQSTVDDLKQTGTQQQAALDRRHHDINVLQSTVDDLKQTGTNDQSIIATQAATIATLEGNLTKAIAIQEGCLAYVEAQLAKLDCEESEQDITHLSPLKDPKVGAMPLSCFVMCL